MQPPVPVGPIITLVYRVAPERRADMLAFLHGAFPVYERPGGIRMALYESMDEPGLFFELVAYASEEAYREDQERVAHDPEMKGVLADWKALLEDPVEFRQYRPVAVGPGPDHATAGLALDAHLAEKVLGWKPGNPCEGEVSFGDADTWTCRRCGHEGAGPELAHAERPAPVSTNKSAAWELIFSLEERFRFAVRALPDDPAERISCRVVGIRSEYMHQAIADTIPLAICRGVLGALASEAIPEPV